MEEIFTTLAAAGVARDDLYLAWDFTVASERNLTERLLLMRDDALRAARHGARPAFTVDAGRGRTSTTASTAASPARSRSTRYVDRRRRPAPASCSDRTACPRRTRRRRSRRLHLHHPARRARGRERHGGPGARVDLRPRAPRRRRRGERRQRPRHGERAQLRLLRDEVDRHVRGGHRQRGRDPAGPRASSRASPTALQQGDAEPALPRPADDPPERLRRRPGLPGRGRRTP